CPDKLTNKNSLLLGDAGIVLRPHVGNGASLALQDALNLCELLCNENLTQALPKWEQATLINRFSMYELSRRMADALVLNPTLWQEMNEETMAHWWQDIIRNDQWYTSLDK
ncbi:MAG: monooxygenase, partial [Legionella sp.]